MGEGDDHERDEHDEAKSSTSREDPDRAAILARRQQFIAVALAGLATGAGCTQASPEPCLSIAAPNEDPKPTEGATEASENGSEDGPETAPKVCLKVAVDPPRDPEPENAGTDAPKDPPEQPEATPKPCLKKAPTTRPHVCLKKAVPKKNDDTTI